MVFNLNNGTSVRFGLCQIDRFNELLTRFRSQNDLLVCFAINQSDLEGSNLCPFQCFALLMFEVTTSDHDSCGRLPSIRLL